MAVGNAKRRRRRRRFRGNFLLAVGLLLVLAAVALAGFNMAEDRSAGEAAGNALEQLLLAERDARDAARRASAETPETPAESGGVTLDPVYPDGENAVPEGEMPVIKIDGYGYIGVLQIPSLDLTLPIISDWSYPALQVAPCRYASSAYEGGLVLSGHNFASHFGHLEQLDIGDEIRFVDLSGNIFTYAVAETEVLEATAIEEMVSGGWGLTLFTCTLSGQTRFTVRCALTGVGS